MQRIIHALLLSLLSSLLATIASADSSQPAIYTVHGKYNTMYLVGTIHLLQADESLPGNINHAYQDAKQLLMEVDTSELDPLSTQAAMMELGMLPEGKTLATELDATAYNKLQSTAKTMGVDIDMLASMRPWMAALTLEQFALAKLGYSADAGVEMQLTAQAAQDHKAITGLETINEQLNLFATLDKQSQRDYLMSTLDELQQMQTEMAALDKAWHHGDEAKLRALLLEGMNANAKLFTALTTDRNRRWLIKLKPLLNSEHDNVLVAVGALHLIGNDGLVSLLKQAGYTVTRE